MMLLVQLLIKYIKELNDLQAYTTSALFMSLPLFVKLLWYV